MTVVKEKKGLVDIKDLQRYIYEIPFRGNKVKALDSEGYYHAVYLYVKSLTSELVFGPQSAIPGVSTEFFCVCKATAVLNVPPDPEDANSQTKEVTFSAIGSAGSLEKNMKSEHMADWAETRAMKRVIHRALDLSKYDIRGEFEEGEVQTTGTLDTVAVPESVRSGEAGESRKKLNRITNPGTGEGKDDW